MQLRPPKTGAAPKVETSNMENNSKRDAKSVEEYDAMEELIKEMQMERNASGR